MLFDALQFISNVTSTAKLVATLILSLIAGSTAAEAFIILFQQETASILESNYLPAFAGGLGGLIVLIVGKFVDELIVKAREKRQREREKESQHITFTDKIAELQKERDDKFYQRLEEFHNDKIAFKDSIIKALKISEYAAKEREHLIMNEVNRLGIHIQLVHVAMKDERVVEAMRTANIIVPEFQVKSNLEIVAGLEEKIAAFAKSLETENPAL